MVAGDNHENWTFDNLIIDEGRDFQAEWANILRLFGRGDPVILWLENRNRGIRGQTPVMLDGFVSYRAKATYRWSESVARFIQKMVPSQFESANDLRGLALLPDAFDGAPASRLQNTLRRP